ncbi:MAG: YHS domain protein [Cytophagaceae bacterium BCCC1]|nr:MAG: YHS domain protein [Cytophagaceae bacterium BCCC1]
MKLFSILAFIAFVYVGELNAQSALRTKQFNLEKGLAIQGFDPVTYFTQNKAIEGNKQFAAQYDGVTYYFSNATNKDLFVKEPKKYEPQYGGWCAYAMGATNNKVEIDPETFKILNGKLYLFFHSWTNNTLLKWNKDEANLKAKADKNWQAIYR